MARRLRPSPALIVALLALFVSIGGVGYAASKIGTNDIKNQAVTKPKIAKKAVTTGRIADQAVTERTLRDQAVTTNKIADLAVTNGKLADLAVTNGKLDIDSVSAANIQDSAVRASELGSTTQAVGGLQAIAAGGTGEQTATCPAGTQVLSGGGFANSFQVHLVTSFQSGNGWHVAYQNTDGANAHSIEAIAVCLN